MANIARANVIIFCIVNTGVSSVEWCTADVISTSDVGSQTAGGGGTAGKRRGRRRRRRMRKRRWWCSLFL
jgi:hypothetical protein